LSPCLRTRARRGHVYIAYEYVPGRTLRHALERGELDDAAAVEAAAQILEGLAHAHARGIVHRDIKPANVLLADGPDVSVRILDFGLALVREEETLTAAGDVPGTLAYISPERLAGDPADAATDVWSTGVLLWEALAARHPFGQGVFLELAKRIGRGAPSLGSARPDLAKPLVRLVDSALAIDPAKRPAAAELAAALRRAPTRRTRPAVTRTRFAVRPLPALPPFIPKLAPAVLAALFAGWVSSPRVLSGVLAVRLATLAAVLTFATPRLGLAFALAVPILPLGNISLGLAIVYSVLAAGWLALFWPRPRTALLFVAGPLLAPLGLLALIPLVVLPSGCRAKSRSGGRGGPRRRGRRVARRTRPADRRRRCARPLLAGLGGPSARPASSCTESPRPAHCSWRCWPWPRPQRPSARSAAAGRGAERFSRRYSPRRPCWSTRAPPRSRSSQPPGYAASHSQPSPPALPARGAWRHGCAACCRSVRGCAPSTAAKYTRHRGIPWL
jgi:hypothetical protein